MSSSKRARAESAGEDAASNTIRSVTCELFKVPLDEVLVDAKHGDHSHFELITVRVTNGAGEEGVGYTYTGGKGGRAIQALVQEDLTTVLLNKDAARIERLYDDMIWHVHHISFHFISSHSHVHYVYACV